MNKLYKSTLTAVLAAGAFINPMTSVSDEVAVPVAQQAQEHSDIVRPHNGMSMKAVEMKLGQPLSISGPVGEPPITTWEYELFNVYFERNLVIHSVLKHN